MSFFSPVPFFRFLIPFIAGILSCIYFPLPIIISIVLLLASFFSIIVFYFIPAFSFSYKYSWVNGVVVSIFFFLSGTIITHYADDNNSSQHFRKFLSNELYEQYVLVKVNSFPVEKGKSIKISVSVEAVKGDSGWHETVGNVLLYIEKDSVSSGIKYGDKILLKTHFKGIDGPKNPGEFDYKQHLAYRNIHHQAYLKKEAWALIDSGNGNVIIAAAFYCRNELLKILEQNNIAGQEYAVAAALILGYEDELAQNTINAFATTGVMHVLSVSGLHVGILFVLFSFVTKGFTQYKYGRVVRAFFLLFIIWLYAVITGLSPSVQRSAMMFSFIVIAESLKKQTNIYNTIAASAFLLLFINPYTLFNVGFQLSYLAVLGIIYIYPKLFEWWNTENKIMKMIWSLTCVSVAAQLATFPLGLFYFHQFPNYFLFSNLVIIPLSTLVLYLGIVLFLVSKIIWLNALVAKVLLLLLKALNGSVYFFSILPMNAMSGIYINLFEMILIYAFVLISLVYFHRKRVVWIYAALSVLITLLTLQVAEQHLEIRQERMIIYNTPGSTVIDFVKAKKNYFVTDSAFAAKETKLLYYIEQHRNRLGIQENYTIDINKPHERKQDNLYFKNGFIKFSGKEMLLFNKQITFKEPVTVDYLLVSENPFINVDELKRKFIFEKIIITSSNSKKNNTIWKKLFQKHKIPYYSVIDSGAYIEEI